MRHFRCYATIPKSSEVNISLSNPPTLESRTQHYVTKEKKSNFLKTKKYPMNNELYKNHMKCSSGTTLSIGALGKKLINSSIQKERHYKIRLYHYVNDYITMKKINK